jgi:hypothetical protein
MISSVGSGPAHYVSGSALTLLFNDSELANSPAATAPDKQVVAAGTFDSNREHSTSPPGKMTLSSGVSPNPPAMDRGVGAVASQLASQRALPSRPETGNLSEVKFDQRSPLSPDRVNRDVVDQADEPAQESPATADPGCFRIATDQLGNVESALVSRRSSAQFDVAAVANSGRQDVASFAQGMRVHSEVAVSFDQDLCLDGDAILDGVAQGSTASGKIEPAAVDALLDSDWAWHDSESV